MALDHFETAVEGLRSQASTLVNQYNADVRYINSDPNLSDEGRTAARNDARDQVKPNITALRQREEALVDQLIKERQSRIESRSGVTSTDIIAFRDAQDRADRLEKQADALPILDRALRQGDTSLAHAIFRRGLEQNWKQITERFTADHPDLNDTVEELRYLNQIKEATFNRTMAYALLG